MPGTRSMAWTRRWPLAQGQSPWSLWMAGTGRWTTVAAPGDTAGGAVTTATAGATAVTAVGVMVEAADTAESAPRRGSMLPALCGFICRSCLGTWRRTNSRRLLRSTGRSSSTSSTVRAPTSAAGSSTRARARQRPPSASSTIVGWTIGTCVSRPTCTRGVGPEKPFATLRGTLEGMLRFPPTWFWHARRQAAWRALRRPLLTLLTRVRLSRARGRPPWGRSLGVVPPAARVRHAGRERVRWASPGAVVARYLPERPSGMTGERSGPRGGLR
mmetsp:Transcript_24444/g.72923  ORF Transcript_24444/g.72923 Transcript_24444/m.72923 type:complete len:272 (+) Transcript_24444:234-1049(+)